MPQTSIESKKGFRVTEELIPEFKKRYVSLVSIAGTLTLPRGRSERSARDATLRFAAFSRPLGFCVSFEPSRVAQVTDCDCREPVAYQPPPIRISCVMRLISEESPMPGGPPVTNATVGPTIECAASNKRLGSW